ncbi:phosphatases II [Laetiporus sulphureus 93-53]|uniref:protein-tyrosine-phosphatase n=1 Tax=Laetiporus sulphureus 93-53 TaxID=1314785 RepID=A0A165F541_9APHY|nr:phosphatases II [Laetiporus sulphureus 93-53]KZT08409.1 phosphatases II [Laetiporus sulphureus 93-53]
MGKREKSEATLSQSAVSLVLPPSLYLGPRSAASSKAFLTANSVSHVLNVGSSPADKVEGVTYHRISLSDSPTSSISKVCDPACEIIDAALKSNNGMGKVLIHCSADISRSPMIVAAYLMKRHKMSLKAALRQIIQVRPQISPNPGFLQQLKELEMELFGIVSLDVDELPKREKDRLALFEEAPAPAEAAAPATNPTAGRAPPIATL